jgi:hypothetical protein
MHKTNPSTVGCARIRVYGKSRWHDRLVVPPEPQPGDSALEYAKARQSLSRSLLAGIIRALDELLQFLHISRPIILLQRFRGVVR